MRALLLSFGFLALAACSASSTDDAASDTAAVSAAAACAQAPCAARPVIFIHGHNGSSSDGDPILDSFTAPGERFDTKHLIGTEDHQAWAPNSLPRREWLFAFDYYVTHGTDPRGSFTAGPGRAGSGGQLCPDHDSYNQGVDHDYTSDFASAIDDVLRATGASQVDIVAHSLGGLITRSYLTFMSGKSKVGNVLFISTPHKGVPLAVFETWFSDEPDWMSNHELTELDRFKITSHSDFSRCGISGTDTFPNALMKAELATSAAGPVLHCMKGSSDKFIYDDSANYERCVDYKEVPGADHGGVLKTPEAASEARAVLGGTFSE